MPICDQKIRTEWPCDVNGIVADAKAAACCECPFDMGSGREHAQAVAIVHRNGDELVVRENFHRQERENTMLRSLDRCDVARQTGERSAKLGIISAE